MKIYRRIIIMIAILMITYLIDYSVKNWANPKNEELVEVFSYSDFDITEATVKCWGKYEAKYLSEDEIRKIVGEIGSQLNLSDLEISWQEDENQKICTLFKESSNAETIIQMTESYQEIAKNTFRVNNYLIVEIKLSNLYASVQYYENLLTNCFEELGISPNTNISAIGSKNGKVSEDEAYQLMETILVSLGGELKSREQVSNAFTLMGYSERFPRYLTLAGEKVNIDMAVTYQEENQKTILNLAIPVITFDY